MNPMINKTKEEDVGFRLCNTQQYFKIKCHLFAVKIVRNNYFHTALGIKTIHNSSKKGVLPNPLKLLVNHHFTFMINLSLSKTSIKTKARLAALTIVVYAYLYEY
jgi:hypothetical protein